MLTSKRIISAGLASATLLVSSVSAASPFDCKLSIGKDAFDLNPLAGVHSFDVSTPTPPTTTKTIYTLSLCSPIPLTSPTEDDCPEGTNVCMQVFSQRAGLEDRLISVVPVAGVEELNPSAKLKEGEKNAETGWLLGLEGGKYNGVSQSAKIEMVCEEGATETVPTLVDYDPKEGVLSLRWATVSACSTNSDHPPPPPETPKDPEGGKDEDTEKESEGMGLFGWFFWLLFFGILAYFVGGAYHNYTQYGATGWDMIPHRDVWRDLPYVAGDLCKGRGGSRSGYSSLG